ncbi:MAG: ester cyclase [Actinobacteria bacterium]|nr:ester cyclase [Actinomycetota bacterium]
MSRSSSDPARERAELIVRAWRVLDGERRLEAMPEFFAEDYVRHSSEGDYDRDQFGEILAALHAGFPDLASSTEETVAEGDRVAYRWVSDGTHAAEYLGVPPTNRRVRATGITISRFGPDGRIVEDWSSWNKTSVLHALGIVPLG